MRAESVFRAGRSLVGLNTHAEALAETSVPKVWGRAEAQARTVEQLGAAAGDAERAVGLLEAAAFSPVSVDWVREAARLLKLAPGRTISTKRIQEVGSQLNSIVSAAWKDNSAKMDTGYVEFARHLLARPPHGISQASLSDLKTLSRSNAVRDEFPGIEILDSAPGDVLRPDLVDAPMLQALTRAHTAVRLGDDPAGMLVEARQIVSGAPSDNAPAAWRTLEAMLALDPDGQILMAPRTIRDAPSLADVAQQAAAGSLDEGAALRYRARWQIDELPQQQVQEQVSRLLAGAPDELGADDLVYVDAALDRWPSIATALDGVGDVDLIREMAAAAVAPGHAGELAQVTAAWTASRPLLDDLRSQARALLERPSEQLTSAEWKQLAQVLADDPDGTIVSVPRELPGLRSLEVIARGRANGTIESSRLIQRYFDEWAYDQLGSVDQARLAVQLLSQPAIDLTRAGWGQLRMILERDVAGAITGVPRALDGDRPLLEIATQIEQGAEWAGVAAQRYFDEWAFDQLSAARKQGLPAELLGKRADELTQGEWRQLRVMLNRDPDAVAVAVPRELPNLTPLAQLAAEIGNGRAFAGPQAQRYFDEWAINHISVAEQKQLAIKLLGKPAQDLSRHEWKQLSLILQRDGDGTIAPVPRELAGIKQLKQIAKEIGDGKAWPDGHAQRYFDAFAFEQLDADGKSRIVSEIMSQRPADLTIKQWRQLRVVLELDTEGWILQLPREVRTALMKLAGQAAEGRYRPDAVATKYFDRWAALNSPEHLQAVTAGIDGVLAGRASAAERKLVRGDLFRLDKLIVDRPADQQLAIVLDQLADPNVGNTMFVRGVLIAIRSVLEHAASPELLELRASITDLVDRSLIRLAGETPPGESPGLKWHPSYSEIGDIRSNVELLRELMVAEPVKVQPSRDLVRW